MFRIGEFSKLAQVSIVVFQIKRAFDLQIIFF